jgi:hypothetical protein
MTVCEGGIGNRENDQFGLKGGCEDFLLCVLCLIEGWVGMSGSRQASIEIGEIMKW